MSGGELTYRNALAAPMRKSRMDELRDWVGDERGKGRTWSQIARASGRPEADLKARFGGMFP